MQFQEEVPKIEKLQQNQAGEDQRILGAVGGVGGVELQTTDTTALLQS